MKKTVKNLLKSSLLGSSILAAGIAAFGLAGTAAADGHESMGHKGDWFATIRGGWLALESDEEALGQQIYGITIGHDIGGRSTFEFGVGYLPDVRGRQFRRPGQFLLQDDTEGVNFNLDYLLHFDKLDERGWFDPYAALGGGVTLFNDELENGHTDIYLSAGLGAFIDITESFFVKPDYRLAMVGEDTEVNHHALISLGYRWGAKEAASVRGAAVDSWDKELRIVYFEFDSSRLTPVSKSILKKNADWMMAHPNEPLIIEGHCDERGTAEYNLALGQRRAQSVYDYLRALGVSAERLRTVSYGEEYPAVAGSNPSAWAKNRRVEFRLDKAETTPVM